MPVLTVVLVAIAAYAVLRAAEARGVTKEKRAKWLFGALVVVALGLVLVRAGLHWVAAGGAVLLGVISRLTPLLRFVPMLARLFGGASQAGGGSGPRAAAPPDPRRMDRREALLVLGLQDDATDDQIAAEHRRLIKQVHPDKGGSSYLAARVNEARDVLLRR